MAQLAFCVTLLAGTAHAQLMSCKTFDSSTAAQAPQFIQDYLGRSKGAFVRVCGSDHPQYYGASGVTKDGMVCRYSDNQLTLSRSNPPRLEMGAALQQNYMLVTKSACPSPVSTNYAATNNVSQNIFEHLVSSWHDAVSSPSSFNGAVPGGSDASAWHRLRTAILQGKGSRLAVLNVVANRDFGLWKSYRLDIADPDHSDQFYVVTVSSWFGQSYGISGVSSGIY